MNRWAYCCNDPVNRMDKTGTWGFSSIVNSVCNVADSIVDSAAFDVVNAALDAAEQLMEDAINACVDLAEVAYDACAAVKEAWDNMDAGLKQWIVMGVSIAVSFIPVVGPLISCIIDGTFVDMLTAISKGDWAMLGMCCLAFIPGAKVMKGLKAVGGIGKAKTFARIMGPDEYASVLKTGKIQSKSGKTFFADASHMSKSSRANASKFSLPNENKHFVEFKIKNQVDVRGPSVVEPKFNRIGGGVEYWVDEGVSIDAEIISHGLLP